MTTTHVTTKINYKAWLFYTMFDNASLIAKIFFNKKDVFNLFVMSCNFFRSLPNQGAKWRLNWR